MAYELITDVATIRLNTKHDGSGYDGTHGAKLRGLATQANPQFQQIPFLDTLGVIPLVPIMTIQAVLQVLPSGLATGAASCPMYDVSACHLVDINGCAYANTFHTGCSINLAEFGHGVRALVLTKVYTVFGQLSDDNPATP